jgi:hypothetical protein
MPQPGGVSPQIRQVLAALQLARAAVQRAPTRSNGRRAVEAKLNRALALAAPLLAPPTTEPTAPIVGDGPEDIARQALTLAREAMVRQLEMGRQILSLPVQQIRTLWALPTLPEQAIREIGRTIRDTAARAIAAMDRNFPTIAATWGQVATGLGGGAIIAVALVAFLLLKK